MKALKGAFFKYVVSPPVIDDFFNLANNEERKYTSEKECGCTFVTKQDNNIVVVYKTHVLEQHTTLNKDTGKSEDVDLIKIEEDVIIITPTFVYAKKGNNAFKTFKQVFNLNLEPYEIQFYNVKKILSNMIFFNKFTFDKIQRPDISKIAVNGKFEHPVDCTSSVVGLDENDIRSFKGTFIKDSKNRTLTLSTKGKFAVKATDEEIADPATFINYLFNFIYRV